MAAIEQAFIVLSGVPGIGKSTYARWLHETYGFVHQDVDRQGLPPGLVLARRHLVVDWRFPANDRVLLILDPPTNPATASGGALGGSESVPCPSYTLSISPGQHLVRDTQRRDSRLTSAGVRYPILIGGSCPRWCTELLCDPLQSICHGSFR